MGDSFLDSSWEGEQKKLFIRLHSGKIWAWVQALEESDFWKLTEFKRSVSYRSSESIQQGYSKDSLALVDLETRM